MVCFTGSKHRRLLIPHVFRKWIFNLHAIRKISRVQRTCAHYPARGFCGELGIFGKTYEIHVRGHGYSRRCYTLLIVTLLCHSITVGQYTPVPDSASQIPPEVSSKPSAAHNFCIAQFAERGDKRFAQSNRVLFEPTFVCVVTIAVCRVT